MANYILDIETIASKRLEEYKTHFEPAPPEPEPEEEPVVEINPKTGKPKRKAAKPKPKSEGRARAKKSERPGLHWLTGRVICVGIKPDGKPAEMFADENEKRMLSQVYDFLDDRKPITLVTFNGKAFDQPYITMRGMLYGLRFKDVIPSEKYSKNHIDLFEEIGGGKWGLPCKLSEAAWFLGLPDVEGSGKDVQQMYDEGRLEDIVAHCKSDIETTEMLFHRIIGEARRKF